MKFKHEIKKTVVEREIEIFIEEYHGQVNKLIEPVQEVIHFAKAHGLEPNKILAPMPLYEQMCALGISEGERDRKRKEKFGAALSLAPEIKTETEIKNEINRDGGVTFSLQTFIGFRVEPVPLLDRVSLGFEDWKHAFIFQKLWDEVAVPAKPGYDGPIRKRS